MPHKTISVPPQLLSWLQLAYSYPDTIHVWIDLPLQNNHILRLRKSNITVKNEPMSQNPKKWLCNIQLQHPVEHKLHTLLDVLDQYPSVDVKISRVDIALDLILPTDIAKQQWDIYIRQHMIQNWNNTPFVEYENGQYSKKRQQKSKNVVVYSDKPCKVDNSEHCVHVECRLQGEQSVKSNIYHLSDIPVLNHVEFWKHNLQLRSVKWDKVMQLKREVSKFRYAHVLNRQSNAQQIKMFFAAQPGYDVNRYWDRACAELILNAIV